MNEEGRSYVDDVYGNDNVFTRFLLTKFRTRRVQNSYSEFEVRS